MAAHRQRKVDGAKVRRLRDEEWLSQEELAQKAHVAIHTISRMETGKHPYPRRSTIFAVADALGVKPEELLRPENNSGDAHPLDSPADDNPQPGRSRRAG